MEDKVVEIARFNRPADAHTLMALLRSEGIECYLRNEITTQLYAGYADVGGARVELLDRDVPRALEIMQEGGYEIPAENEPGEGFRAVSGWASHVPFLRRLPLERQIIVLFGIIAVLLALLIYFGSLVSSN